MINTKKLTLSIVIPVFNEEDYLADCLDSISAQSEMPDEVIVVDNNCTDHSVEIAKKYPFVRVIQEKRQHQSFAQKTGFDATSSDIIGRIDADSVLPNDWVTIVKKRLTDNPKTVAVTGSPLPYDVHMGQFAVGVFGLYMRAASLIAGSRMLWGANCAIRKTAWEKIGRQALLRNDIWEDFDTAMLLAIHGEIVHQPNLEVGVSFRAIRKSFLTQASYQFRCIRTFYLRRGITRAAALSLLWYTMILFYPLILLDEYVLKRLSGLKARQRQILESTALVD